MSAIPAAAVRHDLEAYLAFADARPADERWELIDGELVITTTPTEAHDIVCQNTSDALSPKLKPRGCRLHRSALVRRTDRADFGAVPDIMIRCGEIVLDRRIHTDPIAVFEVLSPSTRGHDRGAKLRHYSAIETLRHIVLVYQNEVRIAHWAWEAGAPWPDLPRVQGNLDDVLVLPSLDLSVSLATIYDGLTPA
jgi:Uma2 family endonuclease